MNNPPLLSVIVPVYKVEEYLNQCVESIINQTYSNLEIILVDDGSPDNCPAMCDDWAKKDSRIKVIHKENAGQAAARNTGIDTAAGEYITFADSDDFLDNRMYEILLQELMEASAQIVMCNCFIYYSSDDFHPGSFAEKEKTLYYGDDANARMFTEFSSWNKIYDKKLFASIRYPQGRVGEDARMIYKVATITDCLVVVPECLYYYRQREGSVMHTLTKREFLEKIAVWDEIYTFEKERQPALEAYIRNRKNDSIFNSILTVLKQQKLKADKALLRELMENFSQPLEIGIKGKLFLAALKIFTAFQRKKDKVKNGQ